MSTWYVVLEVERTITSYYFALNRPVLKTLPIGSGLLPGTIVGSICSHS